MRTLRSLPVGDAEKLKIAEEALNVYAPLAHRMGMMKVKGELEDLAFKHLHPEIFQVSFCHFHPRQSIISSSFLLTLNMFPLFQSTKYTQLAANKAYHEAMEAVQLIMTNDTYLSALGVTFRLSYRIKDKYQLFLKMQRKNLSSVSQVRDALGMRIIIEGYARIPGETDEAYTQRGSDICYHLVSELRAVEGWVPAERGFKDYIQNSKENGYQSLHQYIRNLALGTNVEIQVRTEAMHKAACLGEAAHWFYKDKIYRPKLVDTKIYRHAWRSPLQTTAKSPEELIGMAKQQLLASRVLVFLEDRSTVLNLVKGDTALDATFALHSDLGLTVTTIRIGGQPVPLDYTLQNGDVVTCESSPGVISVTPLWLEMAKSSTALSKIRKYFRESNSRILVCLGLVHLLMTLTLSEERISRRYPNGLPSVAKLADFIKIRTPMSITNFADYLERLGGASVSESASLIGSLLDIPVKDLKISSVSLGLFWARMENKNGWGDKVMQKTLLLPILREVLPALNLPQVESLWVELIGSRSLQLDDKQEALIPLASLFTSRLGPSRKEYNYVYPYVIQAPAHALHSTPYSSLVSGEGTTLTAPQRTSTQVPENSIRELPTESENELVSMSSGIEGDSLSDSIPEGTVLGILGEVKLSVKPWSSHPISVSVPHGKRSTGMYTKSPHNLTRKSVLPVATLASCSTQQMKNKRITEQISARVRTA
jgi:ppGpp synthetase/RelA/SpoT-type nucleotidyltranferase